MKKFIDIYFDVEDSYSEFNIDKYSTMKKFYDEYNILIKNIVSDGGIPLDCECELTPYNIYYLITDIKYWDNNKYEINSKGEAQTFIFNSIKKI